MNQLTHRKIIKWVHWLAAGFILYFFLVEPDLPKNGNAAQKTTELATHAGVSILWAIIILWTILYVKKGILEKPGPKLQNWAKAIFPYTTKATIGINSRTHIFIANGYVLIYNQNITKNCL